MDNEIQQQRDRARGCLIGLAVGDAVGTTLEFMPRGTFTPIDDMQGGGHFHLQKGQWTDDTSMALCLGHSLLEADGFDGHDQMLRYCDWHENGYMSSTGSCFDIGNTVLSALQRFQQTGEANAGATSRWSSGNGAIMRMAPVAIYYHSDAEKAAFYGGESSRTTHASALCMDTSQFFALLLCCLINGADKSACFQLHYQPKTPELAAILSGDLLSKPVAELRGSGYVLESLEAALWCFMTTDNFDECVLAAANLGDDADTTAAVAGQLAGAFYGYHAIRASWRDALCQQAMILQLADNLWHAADTPAIIE